MDLRDRRETYSGFAEALTQAFELVATPAVFGGIGWLVDRWAGTGPLFAVLLVVFASCGMFVRMWFGYDTAMRRHEREAPWARR